jgi:hypothetical protein
MTKARRITAVAAASMVIAAGLVGVATPANAATLSIDCAADDVAGGDVVYTIVAAPGETITIENVGDACTEGGALGAAIEDVAAPPASPMVFRVAANAAPGVYRGPCSAFLEECLDGWGIVLGTVANPTSWIEVIVPGRTDLSTWLQQYQRGSADEACRSGWSASWAQWANGGSGGWVCTRTLLRYAPDAPVS